MLFLVSQLLCPTLLYISYETSIFQSHNQCTVWSYLGSLNSSTGSPSASNSFSVYKGSQNQTYLWRRKLLVPCPCFCVVWQWNVPWESTWAIGPVCLRPLCIILDPCLLYVLHTLSPVCVAGSGPEVRAGFIWWDPKKTMYSTKSDSARYGISILPQMLTQDICV